MTLELVGEWVVAVLLVLGAGFMAVAALGVLRFPDLYNRMQAAGKAGTLAKMLIMSAVAVHFADTSVTARALLISIFFLMTTPIAGHIVSRVAYATGVPLWPGSVRDDLAGTEAAGRAGDDPEPPLSSSRRGG